MSRPVLRAGGLTRQRLSLLWCKESLCFAFHKGSIPAERFPYAAKFLFATKSPLLQNPLCYKIPFAAKSPLLQNPSLLQNSSLLQNLLCCKFPFAAKGPKVSKGRPESPLVASAEAKSSVKRENTRKALSLPFIRNLFLVRGFVRLRADEVLSITGKYPKGAGGVPRVHVSWPPPDPPLLRNSAPLASQGRAQLGSRPSLGGPLSPSAQLIPPPAPGRRSIPEVTARSRHGSATL